MREILTKLAIVWIVDFIVCLIIILGVIIFVKRKK
jgi:hypothetical protein